MYNLVLVRKFEKTDEITVNNVVKNYIMSKASEAVWFCLFREITLQLIVLLSAVLFIFFGVPLVYCVLTVPGVIIFIYASVYASYFNKAIELTNEPYKNCWIAEIYEPLSIRSSKAEMEYGRIEPHNVANNPEVKRMKKQIVGTMSVKPHSSLDHSGWIYRTAVLPEYNYSKVSEYILEYLLKSAKTEGYYSLETVSLECHEDLREMLLRNGFDMKQIYHKHFFGGCLKIMKSQLGINFEENRKDDYDCNFIKIT